MLSIIYKSVNTDDELHQILKLQKANVSSVISQEEKLSQGFVTVEHTFEVLKAMNDKCPHSIVKHGDRVVGYALSMVKDFKDEVEILKPMFNKIDNNLHSNVSYIVMGQICIDKAFRKQGIFRGLYTFMKQQMQDKYDMIVTEVDTLNSRSIKAHTAVGFKTLVFYNSNNQDWAIVYMDLN